MEVSLFCLPIIIIGILGNSLIIVYFIKTQKNGLKKMSSYHFLIIQLAIADLLVSSCSPLVFLVQEYKVLISDFFCKMNSLFLFAFPSISCWILVLLSYERDQAIIYPFKPKTKKWKLQIACFIIWVVFCLAYLKLSLHTELQNGGCIGTLNVEALIYTIFTFVSDCLVPLTFMAFFYVRMSRNMKSIECFDKNIGNNQIIKRKKRALKTVLCLTIAYTLFVVPGRIMVLVMDFLLYFEEKLILSSFSLTFLTIWKLVVLQWIMINNLANVFIYFILMKDFRRFLTLVITCGRNETRSLSLSE